MIPKEPRAGSGAIRDPRDGRQAKGPHLNPPRWMKMGGWSGPSKPGDGKPGMSVEKPMKGAKE